MFDSILSFETRGEKLKSGNKNVKNRKNSHCCYQRSSCHYKRQKLYWQKETKNK